MDYKDAKAVLEVCEKASMAPWIEDTPSIKCPNGMTVCTLAMRKNLNAAQNDMEFIALSREALPFWIQEAERWKSEHAAIECQIHEHNQFGKQYVEEKEAEIKRLREENEALIRGQNSLENIYFGLKNENEALKTEGVHIALRHVKSHPLCTVFGSDEWEELLIAYNVVETFLARNRGRVEGGNE